MFHDVAEAFCGELVVGLARRSVGRKEGSLSKEDWLVAGRQA